MRIIGKVISKPELATTPTDACAILKVSVAGEVLELQAQKQHLIKKMMKAKAGSVIKAEYYQLKELNFLDWLFVYE